MVIKNNNTVREDASKVDQLIFPRFPTRLLACPPARLLIQSHTNPMTFPPLALDLQIPHPSPCPVLPTVLRVSSGSYVNLDRHIVLARRSHKILLSSPTLTQVNCDGPVRWA